MAAEVYVTNFNRNFTGVSATAAAVARRQAGQMALAMVGVPLPGCPAPLGRLAALSQTRELPAGRRFAIWHVRRNSEMQWALIARDLLRRPVRIVFTSAAQRQHSAWPRFLISKMDAIVATTEAAAAEVGNVWDVVHHGVDCARFTPGPDRAAAWAALGHGGARGLACVGRIRPEKGTDLFVAAMIAALPDLPDVVALVIGKATAKHRGFEAGLRARVAQAGLTDRIRFVGEIGAEAMPGVMRGLSLLVALPRYEGYGMTPLEAMASGVPVVASDAGHFRAFLGEDLAGRVVPQEDTAAAAEAVTTVLSDPALWARMSAGALAQARGPYSLDHEVAGINAVYQRLWEGEVRHRR